MEDVTASRDAMMAAVNRLARLVDQIKAESAAAALQPDQADEAVSEEREARLAAEARVARLESLLRAARDQLDAPLATLDEILA